MTEGKRFSRDILVNLAALLVILVILFFVMVRAQTLVVPMILAIFFALMLEPLVARFTRVFGNKIMAIVLALFLSSLLIALVLVGFSYQVANTFQDRTGLETQLRQGVRDFTNRVYDLADRLGGVNRDTVDEWIREIGEAVMAFLGDGLASTPAFALGAGICLICTFFFLFYQKGFKNFIILQFSEGSKDTVIETMSRIKMVAQQYLRGLGSVMLIMAVVNSLGLWIIGVGYPILWGCLAAFLTIIPFVGTTIGGLLPFLYSAATSDSLWQPIAVVIFYATIQQIEGNLITPKVIGNSVSLNSITAFLAILIGGFAWGIAGIILAIPIVAVLRTIFSEINPLKPVALLMSKELESHTSDFKGRYDRPKYRLSRLVKRTKGK